MAWLDFAANSLWLNLLIFGLGAVVIWFAGTKLERYVDAIAERTGLGRAFVGLVLLAGATSLPEMATTVTASLNGNGTLAVNNLMGGVAMQIAILAVADWTLAQGSLTFFTPRFGLLLQGVGLAILLGLAIAALAVGDSFSLWHVGAGSMLLMVTYLFLLYEVYRNRGNPRWQPLDSAEEQSDQEESQGRAGEDEPASANSSNQAGRSLPFILLLFGLVSLAVLAAGWTVAQVADVLTEQLNLSASFVGAVLVAVSTSLPELSTTTAAMRHGNYSTAISNIFGTNMIEVALLFVADLFYWDGSVISTGGSEAIFIAALGLVVTGVYLWGLLERQNRTFMRIGLDSAIVLVVYLAGVVVLYSLS